MFAFVLLMILLFISVAALVIWAGNANDKRLEQMEKMFPNMYALKTLKKQLENGSITEEEYKARRAEIISKL